MIFQTLIIKTIRNIGLNIEGYDTKYHRYKEKKTRG